MKKMTERKEDKRKGRCKKNENLLEMFRLVYSKW
jgi:hypothetical protein